MEYIDLSLAKLKNVTQNGDTYTFSQKGGMLIFDGARGTICSRKTNRDEYIVFDVTNLSDFSSAVTLSFKDGNSKEGITVKIGVLPHVKTTLALKEETAEGGTLFLKRTPGRLKTVVLGTPVKLNSLTSFAFGVTPSPNEVSLTIHSAYFSLTEPSYPVPAVKLVDTLGQKKITSWQGKTKNEAELSEYLKNELQKSPAPCEGFSPYGGYLKKSFTPTGRFALENEGGRWHLKDPLGFAFFSCGLDCVGVDGDCNLTGIEKFCDYLPPKETPGWARFRRDENTSFFSWSKYNLYRVFGDKWYDNWTQITKRRLSDWGFNTVACWSDGEFIRRSSMPYVHILRGFPRTEENIFRDFPDVFSDEYKSQSETWAQQLKELAGDKNMIGYFMSNEPNWAFVDNLNIAAVTLERPDPFATKNYIIARLKEKYSTINSLNSAWHSGFTSFDDLLSGVSNLSKEALAALDEISPELIREFIRVPALALKAVDPNHLNLGMRYAWLSSPALAAGCEYFDVFSFNCYRHDPYKSIENIVKIVNMPVMIGEFHFGALDRGLDATGIQGVATQSDRAKAYRYYMHRAASHPYCLGAHYFTLNDQPYLGRFDGENYQIGFVDVCNREYPEIVEAAKQTHEEVYRIISGVLSPTTDKPAEIDPICY